MELMKGCSLEVNELGGWILDGDCQIFKKIGVRVWIELKKKR